MKILLERDNLDAAIHHLQADDTELGGKTPQEIEQKIRQQLVRLFELRYPTHLASD